MSREQAINVAVTLLVPILSAFLGVLGLVVGDWRLRRTQAGRRKLALEDASRQVSFAAEWWNARKALGDSSQAEQEAITRAVAWLDEASARVEESNPPPVDQRPAVTLRRLLLLYPFQSRAARVLRGAYYVFLGLVPMLVGFLILDILNPVAGVPEYFTADLLIVAALVLLAIGLRLWAQRVETARPKGQKGRRLTLRLALLFYGFHRPAARIVRIVYYIWLLGVAVFALRLVTTAFFEPKSLPGYLIMFLGFVGYMQ
ncbi:hypothetical protein [Mycobacterium sp.]|uniref:hypothetical protein n=1 Tax=Mycobacterium sp. TaxID=1785 RepID=UPI002CD8D01E|nr:hypothetical protein [Mycobacterium sp.]HKP42243.1 hypothetical protein [Mycobacterium sp.]